MRRPRHPRLDPRSNFCVPRNEENPRISPIRKGGLKRAHSRAPLHYCRCDPTGPGHHSGRTRGFLAFQDMLSCPPANIGVFGGRGGEPAFCKKRVPAILSFLSLRRKGILRPCGIEHEFRGHCLTERGDCFESGAMGRHDVVRFQRLDALYGRLNDLGLGACEVETAHNHEELVQRPRPFGPA